MLENLYIIQDPQKVHHGSEHKEHDIPTLRIVIRWLRDNEMLLKNDYYKEEDKSKTPDLYRKK